MSKLYGSDDEDDYIPFNSTSSATKTLPKRLLSLIDTDALDSHAVLLKSAHRSPTPVVSKIPCLAAPFYCCLCLRALHSSQLENNGQIVPKNTLTGPSSAPAALPPTESIASVSFENMDLEDFESFIDTIAEKVSVDVATKPHAPPLPSDHRDMCSPPVVVGNDTPQSLADMWVESGCVVRALATDTAQRCVSIPDMHPSNTVIPTALPLCSFDGLLATWDGTSAPCAMAQRSHTRTQERGIVFGTVSVPFTPHSCGWLQALLLPIRDMVYCHLRSLAPPEDAPPSSNSAAAARAETLLPSPSPVQRAVVPLALHGYNLSVTARTGAGKTLALTLPCVCAAALGAAALARQQVRERRVWTALAGADVTEECEVCGQRAGAGAVEGCAWCHACAWPWQLPAALPAREVAASALWEEARLREQALEAAAGAADGAGDEDGEEDGAERNARRGKRRKVVAGDGGNLWGTQVTPGSVGRYRSTENMCRGPFALVVVPTRELAAQVHGVVAALIPARWQLPAGGSRPTLVMNATGGLGRKAHVQMLRAAQVVDVVVGTPGRLLDLLGTGDSFDARADGGVVTVPAEARACVFSLLDTMYVAVDECDSLCALGMHAQLLAVLAGVRAHAQVVLLSATADRRARTAMDAIVRRFHARGRAEASSDAGCVRRGHWLSVAQREERGHADAGALTVVGSGGSTGTLARAAPEHHAVRLSHAVASALSPPPAWVHALPHHGERGSARAQTWSTCKTLWLCASLAQLLRAAERSAAVPARTAGEGLQNAGSDANAEHTRAVGVDVHLVDEPVQALLFVNEKDTADQLAHWLTVFLRICADNTAATVPQLPVRGSRDLSPALALVAAQLPEGERAWLTQLAKDGQSESVHAWQRDCAAEHRLPVQSVRVALPNLPVACLHGGRAGVERRLVASAVREGAARLLVATDVAARGLDVPGVGLVVSVDAPRDTHTATHRAGRCGRPGQAAAGLIVSVHTGDEPS